MPAELLQRVPENIVNLVRGLEPLKGKYPILEQVDLVIEGGVGCNRDTAYVVRFLFPRALYIGTDPHPVMVPIHKMRLDGSIDPQILQKVQEANKSDGLFPEGAWLRADCFDKDLVRDIMHRGAYRFPLLISLDALPFFMRDIDSLLSMETPFIGQLHVSRSQLWHYGSQLWHFWHYDGPRPGDNVNEEYYYELAELARAVGWVSDRLPNALILLR